ncbi:MAG: DUF1549 domain-containing protein [Chitinophagaceae bacterium]
MHKDIISLSASLLLLLVCLINPFLSQDSLGQSLPVPTGDGHFWLWDFLGRLHPLAIHFPVSLLILAALLELFTMKKFNSRLRAGINVLVFSGVAMSVISAVFGLLLARNGDYGENLLSLHQWTGIATACLGIASLLLLIAIHKHNRRNLVKPYRVLLFCTVIAVSTAGHFGASLTHGDAYLTSAIPWSEDYEGESLNIVDFATLETDTSKLTKKQENDLNVQVRSILAHNCYKCHGAEKVKGELRLDRKDMVFKGGESGPVILPGNPAKSEIMRRITLPRDDKEAMPSKGKKLANDEISLIHFWISKGAPWPEGSDKQPFRVAKLEPRNPMLPAASAVLQNPVDIWVNDYFKLKKLKWPSTVDDRIYLRRVFLDIIGLLPTPEDQVSFSQDTRPNKRSIWVKQLLNRKEDYAIHWMSFWNDALRNDYTGTGYITKGRFAITDWLYKSLQNNKPYDRFVHELVSPGEESQGFIKGIKWRGVINASQKTEMQAAQNVAQVFFGLNLKCASCHNSFINDWKLEDAYAFANIFADSSLEINRCDKPTGKFTTARLLWKELGGIQNQAPAAKKQQQLAELMTKPENGRLYRTIVNRIWAQLMGRGLVEPVDNMDNEPWSQDLLDWLAVNFVQTNYDIKELIYLITSSRTYQLTSTGYKDANKIMAGEYIFEGMIRRRLSAEQFSDAVSTIIGPAFPDSLVKYNPFKKGGTGQSKQPFARASLVVNNPFLTALGRPNRETVSTSRESQANLLQALELTNGERFNAVLLNGAEKWRQHYRNTEGIIQALYRKALGREPLPDELALASKMLGVSPTKEGIQDLFWAVLLLPEFQIIY